MRAKILLATLLLAWVADAGPSVLQRFEIWGKSSKDQKLTLYIGWSNGYFFGREDEEGMVELADCIQERLTFEQAIAIIDKRYKALPEKWGEPLTPQILAALTAKGSPCEGKSPLKK